jgi:hypothetical protein
MKKNVIIVIVASAAAAAWATSYLGSVVNSWDGTIEGPSTYRPSGVAYGDGYIWLGYGTFFTPRVPANGSIVDLIGFSGPGTRDLGYESSTKYLYFGCGSDGVYWRESTSGSTVGSFRMPPGAIYIMSLDFDNANPAAPLWLGDIYSWRIWNVTSAGSVVRSLQTPFGPAWGVAYDDDTAGGPYLFAASWDEPPVIYALAPASGSIYYSFTLKICPKGVGGMTWDGNYLWTVDDRSASPLLGMVHQFIAHEPNVGVVPASLGRIKALYQ